MKLASGLAACAAALLLGACAVFYAPVDRQPPAAPFDLLGRMLASNEGRAFSSGFRWRHVVDQDEIWLLSPVGQTLAYIAADADGAKLTAAGQQAYHAQSVESLTRRAWGWSLPLDQMQHWVAGGTAPGTAAANLVRDAQGRLEAFEQDGWLIRYAYPEAAATSLLPRRLELRQDGHQIRIVIDQWRHGAAP